MVNLDIGKRPGSFLLLVTATLLTNMAQAANLSPKLSGFVAAESRVFREDALYSGQEDQTASLVLQPELYWQWNDGKSGLSFIPFVRTGDKDDERNHADIRELMWLNVFGDWELRLGIGKVFWGVTESQHLVDIINQTDLVENIDGEDKLGQPMMNLTRITDFGTWDFFILPGFRERTFPGVKGRFRGPLVVDTDQAQYESPDEDEHIDWAIRWAHYIGDWDIGLSHFSGTSRDPVLVPGTGPSGPVLIPRYDLIDQTGLTLQAILGSWLWKLEATSTEQRDDRYFASVAGFEYTYVGIMGSVMDLGMLAEHHYDDRGDLGPTPFEDDLMVGLRWVFNDIQSSEVLAGVIRDLDGGATSVTVEASRRFGQNWKLNLEYRGSNGVESTDPLFIFRNDDYLQLELARYF